MTKPERDRLVAEALEWMQEDGLLPSAMGKRAAGSLAKFPGWTWDEGTARALLESSLVAYPGLRLLPCLADFRMRWIARGPANRQAWMARWRNWLRKGVEFSDPLVTGKPPAGGRAESREPRAERGIGMRSPSREPRAERDAMAAPIAAGDVVQAELAKIRARLGG